MSRPLLFLLLFFLKKTSLDAQPTQRYEFTHPQMGTTFRLVFFAKNDSLARVAAAETFARVDSLNAIFSDYLPDSELNRLCETAGKIETYTSISPDLDRILRQARAFSYASEGAFDVTVGPLTRLWRRARSRSELPDSARVEEARALVNFKNVWLPGHCGMFMRKMRKVEALDGSVRLVQPGMKLDLGGIAQGYAADECLKILKKHGIRRALADAGGDIALGCPPPGERRGWRIEIPAANGTTKTIFLKKCGITTSGATYRYLEVGGKRYSHIVDPRTGWALTHRTLVTVRARNATTADAWATAISVLGEKGWKKLPRKTRRGLRVWLTEMPL